jgi:hypothetical protein
MTAAEKAAIKAEKDAKEAKEKAEKAATREAKKAETAAKKAEKDAAAAARKAERAAKKAEKDAAAAAEKAAKDAKKTSKPVAKGAPVKAAPVKAAPVKAAPVKDVAAPVKAAGGAGAKRPIVVAEEWIPPTGDAVKAWSFKGKVYLRNKDNEVWLKGADGGYGEWQGVYIPAEDKIDDSIPEPTFDE